MSSRDCDISGMSSLDSFDRQELISMKGLLDIFGVKPDDEDERKFEYKGTSYLIAFKWTDGF